MSAVQLISAHQLHSSLVRQKQITVIDARTRSEFEQGHIPGAVWLGWEEWCTQPELGSTLAQPGYWGLLDDSRCLSWENHFSKLGLGNDLPMVIYANSVLSKGREGRIAWMLLYLGCTKVFLLDGGWPSWLASCNHQQVYTTHILSSLFEVSPQTKRRARINQLKRLYCTSKMPIMIDVRSDEEFAGNCFQYMPRMGRMPQSFLLPFTSLFDEGGRFISRSKYLKLLPQEFWQAGKAVLYCEVGVRAGVAAVLHEIYTGQILPVYDGSMMEWSTDAELPVY